MRLLAIILLAMPVLVLSAAEAAELSPSEAAAGRKIYIAKCAKCHELYDPKAYNNTEWADWMKKMGKKSKLKPEQSELLFRYTETLRRPVSPPAKQSNGW